MFKNIKIKTSIIIMIIFSLIFTMIIGYYGIANLKAFNNETSFTTEKLMPSIALILNADRDMYQVHTAMQKFTQLKPDSDEWKACIKDVDENLQQVRERVEGYAKNATIAKQRELIDSHVKDREEWAKKTYDYIEKLKTAKAEDKETLSKTVADIENSFGKARSVLNELTEISEKMAMDINESMKKTYVQTKINTIFIIVLNVLLMLILLYFVSKHISIIIHDLIGETSVLMKAANEEKFEIRGECEKINFEFREIVSGINRVFDKMAEKIFWYEQLLDAIPFPISVTDNQMNWTFINQPVEKFLSIKRRDVVGKQCNNWGAGICKTENCGIEKLRKGIGRTTFAQLGMNFQVDTSYIKNIKGETIGHIETVQDITAGVKSAEFMNAEVNRLAKNLHLISEGDMNLDLNVADGDNYTINERANFIKIAESVKQVKDSIELMLADANKLSEAAAVGNLMLRSDASVHKGSFKMIITGMNNTVEAIVRAVTEVMGCLGSMANGNLDVEMKGEYGGDLLELKSAVNKTLKSINEILNHVNISAEQVNTGAQQVSDASQSLSQSAAEQASSLEEISATMHEISSQSRSNAESAVSASNLARQARSGVERGNLKMKQMQVSMSEINESAANISKIIKAIDEIAFQTNLLALNAAVEAARAGKHGKGFTVVAEEVRNLAQRSAKAAKETAEMIEGSIIKTEDGTKIANETAQALELIVADITKVTDLIGEISAASKEQDGGVKQISLGLEQVDHVTQQNTATAEEAAAASEELSSQALELKSMLLKFKLKKSENAVNAYVVEKNDRVKKQNLKMLKPGVKK